MKGSLREDAKKERTAGSLFLISGESSSSIINHRSKNNHGNQLAELTIEKNYNFAAGISTCEWRYAVKLLSPNRVPE
jgi:hypothetical protein